MRARNGRRKEGGNDESTQCDCNHSLGGRRAKLGTGRRGPLRSGCRYLWNEVRGDFGAEFGGLHPGWTGRAVPGHFFPATAAPFGTRSRDGSRAVRGDRDRPGSGAAFPAGNNKKRRNQSGASTVLVTLVIPLATERFFNSRSGAAMLNCL